jgi:hypothetical protein
MKPTARNQFINFCHYNKMVDKLEEIQPFNQSENKLGEMAKQ